jgi:hypothetical protein
MPTYKQNQGADLLPDGVYPFYVKNAKLSTSQQGNEKIELTLQVNGTFTVYDNLTFTENSGWKIDQFRIATGEVLGAAGSDASIEAEDCIQRRGEVDIGNDEFPKGSGRTRNVVAGYIDPKRSAPEQPKGGSPKVKPADPDDIPF